MGMNDQLVTAEAIWRSIDDLTARVGTIERQLDMTTNPPIPVSLLVLAGMLFVYLVVMALIVLYLAVG